jgi:DNA-binding protein HU-beta/integration host factor subunit beta
MSERARVTKEDIVRTLAAEHGVRQADVKLIVQGTLDAIVDAVLTCGRLELRDFGVFEVRARKARRLRNPQTGEPVEVPETQVVTFRPGCNFRRWVRGRGVKEPEN